MLTLLERQREVGEDTGVAPIDRGLFDFEDETFVGEGRHAQKKR